MRAILDTSVLISGSSLAGVTGAISVVSISELHFGVLVATDEDERTRRLDRLTAIEQGFDPIPVTVAVARTWGRLAAAVAYRGGRPRRRQLDLAIAATAIAEGVPLLTSNVDDFQIISDLVEVRHPDEVPR